MAIPQPLLMRSAVSASILALAGGSLTGGAAAPESLQPPHAHALVLADRLDATFTEGVPLRRTSDCAAAPKICQAVLKGSGSLKGFGPATEIAGVTQDRAVTPCGGGSDSESYTRRITTSGGVLALRAWGVTVPDRPRLPRNGALPGRRRRQHRRLRRRPRPRLRHRQRPGRPPRPGHHHRQPQAAPIVTRAAARTARAEPSGSPLPANIRSPDSGLGRDRVPARKEPAIERASFAFAKPRVPRAGGCPRLRGGPAGRVGGGAGERAHAAVFSVPGARGAGPARYDRVLVERFGPASARTVLVLVPGSSSGAGAFAFVARDLVRRVPRAAGVGGRAARAGLRGHVGDRARRPRPGARLLPAGPTGRRAHVPATAGLRGRIHGPMGPRPAARRPAPGHPQGARRGPARDPRRALARRLRGRGLRQLGLRRPARPPRSRRPGPHRRRPGRRHRAADARAGARTAPRIRDQRRASIHSTRAPRGSTASPRRSPASTRNSSRRTAHRWTPSRSCPPPCKPPFPSTNETWLGWARNCCIPRKDPPPRTPGTPRASGNPRAWVDGDITPIARLARWLAQAPINTIDWYVPRRLLLDIQAADPLKPTPLTRLLHLRLKHRRAIHLPLYAFQTSSSAPHVLHAARRLARSSHIASPTLAADPTMIHSDPLTALPARNSFLRTVTPFLKHLAH